MSNRETWLAERATAIGASESPILFRQGYAGTSTYRLWAQKLGMVARDDMDDVESIRWGQRLEPVIIQGLREDHGFDVQPALAHDFLRHPEHPHIGCTLDARVFDDNRSTPGTCEIKNVGVYFSKEWTETPPLRVLVQCQHQLAVTGYEWGIAAGLVGGNRLKFHVFERHEKIIATLINLCNEFWQNVTERTPPEIDGSEATRSVLQSLHPADTGRTIVLGDEFATVFDEWESLKAQAKQIETSQLKIENRLRAAMRDSTFARLPCRRWASLKFSKACRSLRLHISKPDGAVLPLVPANIEE